MKLRCREAAIEQGHRVELRLSCDPIDLIDQLIHFQLDRLTIGGRVRVVRCLHRELTHPLQARGDALHATLGRLRQRNAIGRITDRLVITANLRRRPLGNGQARRIVFGAVDPKTRAQSL